MGRSFRVLNLRTTFLVALRTVFLVALVSILILAIGAIIEFLQAILFVQGNPQFNDWLADNLGLALMLAVLWGAQQVIEGLWPDTWRKPPPHS